MPPCPKCGHATVCPRCIGSAGGAVTGACKARSSEQAAAAALVRWEKVRAVKAALTDNRVAHRAIGATACGRVMIQGIAKTGKRGAK